MAAHTYLGVSIFPCDYLQHTEQGLRWYIAREIGDHLITGEEMSAKYRTLAAAKADIRREHEYSRAAQALGRKGGSAKSAAKTKSSKANGAKSKGRPPLPRYHVRPDLLGSEWCGEPDDLRAFAVRLQIECRARRVGVIVDTESMGNTSEVVELMNDSPNGPAHEAWQAACESMPARCWR